MYQELKKSNLAGALSSGQSTSSRVEQTNVLIDIGKVVTSKFYSVLDAQKYNLIKHRMPSEHIMLHLKTYT